ncbi:MAG: phosphate signaling complex protein PhoU [Candidatus Hydrothermia bacterium]|jgi:phosphate transport system protein|nr:phosphate signaling complex protein PhoU [Candidatus Hydrothermia bacterium]
MRKALSDELKELEEKIFQMSDIIRNMFLNCNNYEEILKLEDIVNQSEIEIEFFAIKILALYQPEAMDLRKIITAIKVNNDLERIADHIENIARDFYLIKDSVIISIEELFNKVFNVFEKSINAYKNNDVITAREVLSGDSEIDNLRNELINKIVSLMTKDSNLVDSGIKTINIIQNLERIGDLCTNICEDVIFLMEGKIFKHGKEI